MPTLHENGYVLVVRDDDGDDHYTRQRESPRLQSWGESRPLRRAYIGWRRIAHRPRRHARPHAGTIGQYRASLPESRRYPLRDRNGIPTQNKQVPPNPSRDRSNGGVALPALSVCERKFPNQPQSRGGKPATSVVGGCHVLVVHDDEGDDHYFSRPEDIGLVDGGENGLRVKTPEHSHLIFEPLPEQVTLVRRDALEGEEASDG